MASGNWIRKIDSLLSGRRESKGEQDSPSRPSAPLESIIEISQGLHGSGTFSPVGLRALARYAESLDEIKHSVETGSGASTLLFSHLSRWHETFTIDSGSGSLENVRASSLFHAENVSIVEGATQVTLPKHAFSEPIQFALIDGPHGYPFPDLEYFYLYPHIETGGILVVDDTHIRSIRNLMDFLTADDMWILEEVVEATAFFRRTSAPTFCQTGDGWWLQKYNSVNE